MSAISLAEWAHWIDNSEVAVPLLVAKSEPRDRAFLKHPTRGFALESQPQVGPVSPIRTGGMNR